ncbi:MAG: carbamoyl phosphate synthase large subunit, partial [Nitrospinaceae bacterium]
LLGPEMKSTGEVMGIDREFGLAFAKSQIATGLRLPLSGTVFISVKDEDKPRTLEVARGFLELGYDLLATRGTASYLKERGLRATPVNKVKEGSPHVVEALNGGQAHFVINTVFGEVAIRDSFSLRRASLNQNLPYCTTMAGAAALLRAMQAIKFNELDVTSLQEYAADRLPSQ